MKICVLLSVVVLLQCMAPNFAKAISSRDLEPVNPSEVMSGVEKLRNQNRQQKFDYLREFINLCKKALASETASIDFYKNAMLATAFAGQNKEMTALRDWRLKNEALLKSSSFRDALQLHIQYLILTARKAGGEELASILPDLLRYVAKLDEIDDPEVFSHRDWLGKSVAESVLLKQFQLEKIVAATDNWVMVPGNYANIIEKVILPYWRDQKNPEIVAYWDKKIQRRQEQLEDNKLKSVIISFNEIELPAIRWNQAKEYFVLDQPNRAITAMYKVLQNSVSHPSFEDWAKEIEASIQKLESVEANAPSVAPAP